MRFSSFEGGELDGNNGVVLAAHVTYLECRTMVFLQTILSKRAWNEIFMK